MQHDSLFGPEAAPREPAGLGPSDSSDSGSDRAGVPDLLDEDDNIPGEAEGGSEGEPRRPAPDQPNPEPDRPQRPDEDGDDAIPPPDERGLKERRPGRGVPLQGGGMALLPRR